MSTSCTITMYHLSDGLEYPTISIYQHSDSYPEVMLDELVEFVRKFIQKRGYYDVEYIPARLIQHLTNQYDAELNAPGDDVFTILGFGVNKSGHYNCEYNYKITPKEIRLHNSKGMLLDSVEF